MIEKIKKQIGSREDMPGFMVFVLNRTRMYMGLFGIPFLVIERFFAIMNIDLGLSEYFTNLSQLTIWFGLTGILVSGVLWIYLDLKFIFPSEKRTSTKRDPIINELLEKVNGLCSDSKLQQRQYALPLVEAIGKPYPQSSGR